MNILSKRKLLNLNNKNLKNNNSIIYNKEKSCVYKIEFQIFNQH